MEDRFNKTYEVVRGFDGFEEGDRFKPNKPHTCSMPCNKSAKCRGSYGYVCIQTALNMGSIKEVKDYQYYLKQY